MSLKQRINTIKSQLHDELDIAEEIHSKINYDKNFGMLVSYTTRLKILRGLINCFKLIKYDRISEIKIESISKRIKLHLYQIKKLEQTKKNYEDNKTFFYESVKVILCFITEQLKLRC
jgi:hypothetical protein